MSKKVLFEAYRNLPDDERILPASVKALSCSVREEAKAGRCNYVRLTLRQAEILVNDFKQIRERLAMCRNDLARATLGKPLPKYGRLAQFRVSRKAEEAPVQEVQSKVAPKWAKVLEDLKKGGSK